MCLHTHLHCKCAICGCVCLGVCVHYIGRLAFWVHSCKVGLISAAELAVVGGVLKGPDCEESSQLSSCCTLPLLLVPRTRCQWRVWFHL